MRRALVIALVGVAVTLAPLAAEPSADELSTDAAHEVRHVPPAPVPIRGPRFAAVTIDLYFAFGHGPSAVGAELARRAVESARNHDVRELVRLAPAGPISNSAGAELGAEALLEAEAQGRPIELFDRVQHDHAALTPAELVLAGREAGLDADRLAAALEDHRHQPEVERRLKEALLAGRSAGELMVNGRRSSVWISEEGLSVTITEARRRAVALLEDGVPLGHVYDQLTQPADEAPLHDNAARGKKRLAPELSGAPARGAPTLAAPVTVVVFSNLACGSCGDTAEVMRRLRAAWPGRVREVWRNFVPAYATANTIDWQAAELAVAATRQDRFWALHDALFAPGRAALPRRTRADLESTARSAGIDLARRDPNAERAQVEREQVEARRLNVPFAPALMVNGTLYPGTPSFERMDRAVRAELERGLTDRLSQ